MEALEVSGIGNGMQHQTPSQCETALLQGDQAAGRCKSAQLCWSQSSSRSNPLLSIAVKAAIPMCPAEDMASYLSVKGLRPSNAGHWLPSGGMRDMQA